MKVDVFVVCEQKMRASCSKVKLIKEPTTKLPKATYKKAFLFLSCQNSFHAMELIHIALLSQYEICFSNIAWKKINNTEIRGVIECN